MKLIFYIYEYRIIMASVFFGGWGIYLYFERPNKDILKLFCNNKSKQLTLISKFSCKKCQHL